MKMQPSEVDKLSVYEFRLYMNLLNKQLQEERDYELKLAQSTGLGGIFSH